MKWIEVNQQLPKNNQPVLILLIDETETEPCYSFITVGYYCPIENTWIRDLQHSDDYPVSHWMPLPEPPKQ